MMDFGWKAKAERLRRVILSAGHQSAKELPLGVSKTLEAFAQLARTGDMQTLHQAMAVIKREHPGDVRPLYEPIEVHGWIIDASLYRKESLVERKGQGLWWLVHATRKNAHVLHARSPSDKDIVFLNKVLDHLGCVPTRHAIIEPLSLRVEDNERLPFGWWTWQNQWPLYDIQVNKDKKRDQDKVRIVPLGSRETEGYTSARMDDVDDKESLVEDKGKAPQ